ncbi:hypothetical protein ACS0TY_026583 [Phlomoides rotata]
MEGKWALILISIILVTFINYAVKLLDFFWFKPKKKEAFLRNQGINGNPYRPFLGDLKDFFRITKEEEARSLQLSDDIIPHIYAYNQRVISKHGPNSFHWIGPYPWLNLTDPELIKEVLRRPDVFEKGLTGPIKILAGGLPSHEGEKWAKHRKIINPAFHVDKLKWENMLSDSNEIDVWPDIEDLSGNAISLTAFGSNYEDGRKIYQLTKEKFKLALQLVPLFFLPAWRFVPLKAARKVKKASEEMESILRVMIEKRYKEMQSGEGVGRDDLLGILWESNSRFIEEEGKGNAAGLSIEEVIEECQIFYLAGSTTTSCLLLWAMFVLSIHPEWQTRAREEVVRVFGNKDLNFEALNRLKIVTMILQEVLRLYTPVPLTSRRTKEQVKIGNITIPAGVYVNLFLALPHHDPEIWGDDVKEFKPQRFSEGVSKAANMQSSTFIPFGLGPRSCIGQNFAMIEVKIALAMILRRFSFELSPSYSHAPFGLMHLAPQYGAPMIFHKLSIS